MDATDRMKIGELRWFGALLALAFGILCLEVLSLNLAIHVDGSAPYTLIWPSSALALYVFMRYGTSLWPAFLLADAFLPFFSDFNSVEALATAVADLATLPAAAWLLGRLGVTNNPLRSVRDFVAFILIGAIGASFLSTMFGLGTVFLFRPLSGTIGELLSEWGLEGAMSTIVFAPPMWIEWRRRDPARAGGRGELIAIFLYMTVVGYLAFFYDLEPKSWQRALPYLMVPGAIWAAIRFGSKGATSILLYGCTLAVVGTVRGNGPFATNPIQPGITNLQAFMGVTAMAALLIAAALSESLAARRALEASEGKYRNLVETSGDLIWSVDPQGRWTFINNAIHATHGYKPEDLLGKPFADLLYSEEQRAKDMAAFERIKGGESVFRYETIHRRRDGLPVVLSFNAIVLRDGSGAVVGTTGTATDITELTRSQDQLRASEERFRSIFEFSPIGIYIGRRGRPLYVNLAFVRMFGFDSSGEALTKSAADLVAPERREELVRIAQRREAGEPAEKSYEIVGLRKDSSRFAMSVLVDRIPLPDGEATVAFLTDLTERKNLEDQLRQSQKMEAVGRLAGGVAHDFNNLLTVILGYCDLLKDSLSRSDPLYKGVAEMARAGTRAADLTQQLLAFSRRQVIDLQPLVLDARLRSTAEMLRRIIGEDIELVTSFAPGLHVCRADATQLDQLLLNLVVNARDAMPRGGAVTIATENVAMPARPAGAGIPEGEYVLLSVADTGIGMDAETQTHLFEPFFTTKRDGKGTGLGMATVYGIVQQCGAHITVESAVGQGTTIRIFFPRFLGEALQPASPKAPAAGAQSAEGEAGAKETILLVEDEDIVRGLAKHALERQGYKVLEAASGARALEIASSRTAVIDLVVTDVVMPHMSGPDLAKRLAEIVPDARILYISGYTEGQALDVGLAKSRAPLLAKPFTPTQLVERVQEVLASRA